MGSLSDLFLKYGSLLEDAFDLDEDGDIVEKDASKVAEADTLFHNLFVSDMHQILTELGFDPHAPQHMNTSPWEYERPSWLSAMGMGGQSAYGSTAQNYTPATGMGGRVVTKVRTSRPDLVHGSGNGPPATSTGPAYGVPRPPGQQQQGQPGQQQPPPGQAGSSQPASMAGTSFGQKAPAIMQNLMRDFGLKDYQAAAIVGNIGAETGGFHDMQEVLPKGSQGRGGFGWAQWTGSRRNDFENYAKTNNLDPTSDEANYGFLKQEIATKYPGAIAALKNTTNPQDATIQWEGAYEGAGVKHYFGTPNNPGRVDYANQALSAYNNSQRLAQNNNQAQPQNTNVAQNTQGDITGGIAGNYNGFLKDPEGRLAGDKVQINPNVVQWLNKAGEALPTGWHAEVAVGPSQHTPGTYTTGAPSQVPKGLAADIRLVDPSGRVLPHLVAHSPQEDAEIRANPDFQHFKQLGDAYVMASGGNGRWGGNYGLADTMQYGTVTPEYPRGAKASQDLYTAAAAQAQQRSQTQIASNQQPQTPLASNVNQPSPVQVASSDTSHLPTSGSQPSVTPLQTAQNQNPASNPSASIETAVTKAAANLSPTPPLSPSDQTSPSTQNSSMQRNLLPSHRQLSERKSRVAIGLLRGI